MNEDRLTRFVKGIVHDEIARAMRAFTDGEVAAAVVNGKTSVYVEGSSTPLPDFHVPPRLAALTAGAHVRLFRRNGYRLITEVLDQNLSGDDNVLISHDDLDPNTVNSEQHHPRAHDHGSAADGTILDLTALNFTGLITPSILTADVNNYDPNGKDDAWLWRLSADAAWSITGAVAPPAGLIAFKFVKNVGTFQITLVHNSASSTAANRFYLPNNASIILTANDAAFLVYDPVGLRWSVEGR